MSWQVSEEGQRGFCLSHAEIGVGRYGLDTGIKAYKRNLNGILGDTPYPNLSVAFQYK